MLRKAGFLASVAILISTPSLQVWAEQHPLFAGIVQVDGYVIPFAEHKNAYLVEKHFLSKGFALFGAKTSR